MTDEETFLFGVDLFNHQFFWEAHEFWEVVWKRYKGETTYALFIQSLIQFAACCLKRVLESPEGIEKLRRGSLEKLEKVEKKVGPFYKGVDLHEIREGLATVRIDQEFTPPEIRLRLGDK